jgi:hypothetical protein
MCVSKEFFKMCYIMMLSVAKIDSVNKRRRIEYGALVE